ncbi:proline-rich protein 36-like isoform X2 [Siniperca chuatsi]|uniref:proline-rich protein 36-like isoform X1 n=1 Tax=Siniperca chuatsi TaxID=119488 RepID=UPI001CE0F481|nr:proline-rich protein 36-like isoform X1 [Siniperca chuatsi]XP_044035517.1 proline-rich protein 36-like isoform X2 [Siniperca chuatsi]
MWSTNIRPEELHAAHTTKFLSSTSLLRISCCASESNMVLGLSLRVSWICLLLFSSGAAFPASKEDYKYPYIINWGSSGVPAPGSNLNSEGSQPSLASLQDDSDLQLASSASGNKPASSVAAGSSPSYKPNRFTYDSSSSEPSTPEVPSQTDGYVSPPVRPRSPPSTGTKTDSFALQPLPVAGSSGNSNMGSDVVAPQFPYPSGLAYPAGNMATLDSQESPVRYVAAATYDLWEGPQYGNPSTAGSLPWLAQPASGADSWLYNPSNWMPSPASRELSVFDPSVKMPQSLSEGAFLPRSSYIIQSRNGYRRASKVYSNTKYSPQSLDPPVFPSKPVKAPRRSPPASFTKG